MAKNKNYPKRLKFHSGGETHEWELVNGLIAKLNVQDEIPIEHEVMRLEPGIAISKVPDDQDSTEEGDNEAPLYKVGTNGAPGVATGLIFVRPIDGIALEDCRESVKKAGFEIEKTSPSGGFWVRHQTGSIKASLIEYQKILEISDIQTAEPQLLMKRQSKTVRGSRNKSGRRKPTSDL